MTEKSDSKNVKQSISLRMWPGFLTILFVSMAATGNCSVCGFSKDYVGRAVECR